MASEIEYEYRETGFDRNMVVIDQEDCGCVDCTIRHAIPMQDGKLALPEELARDITTKNREIFNRTGVDLKIEVFSEDHIVVTYKREIEPIAIAYLPAKSSTI